MPGPTGPSRADLERVLARIHEEDHREIRCKPGWYPIIIDLDQKLAELCPGYVVLQVKEKWAGLRYYFELPAGSGDQPALRRKMHALVDEAESRAATTCELCGRGRSRVYESDTRYLRVMCRRCVSEAKASGGSFRKPKH